MRLLKVVEKHKNVMFVSLHVHKKVVRDCFFRERVGKKKVGSFYSCKQVTKTQWNVFLSLSTSEISMKKLTTKKKPL